MLALMALLLSFGIAVATAWFGYRTARRFVRDRLRYVEAARKSYAPWLAGGATFLAASLLTLILPLVGVGTALTAGVAVGSGVAAGARDIKKGNVPVIFGR